MQTVQTPSGTLADQVAGAVRATMGYLGINQAELARRLGVSDMWVSARVRKDAQRPLDLAELEQIADALDVPVARFLPAAEPTPGTAR